MESLSIERRIQLLEDKEAIKDITYQYAMCINQGWNGIEINPKALLDIFTMDAIWESEAERIATCMRVLVHDTEMYQALQEICKCRVLVQPRMEARAKK